MASLRRCSFCSEFETKTRILVASPDKSVFICSECIALGLEEIARIPGMELRERMRLRDTAVDLRKRVACRT